MCYQEVVTYRCKQVPDNKPIKKTVYECREVPYCQHKLPRLGHGDCCPECEACPKFKKVLVKKEIVVGETCGTKCVPEKFVERIPVPCCRCGYKPANDAPSPSPAPIPMAQATVPTPEVNAAVRSTEVVATAPASARRLSVTNPMTNSPLRSIQPAMAAVPRNERLPATGTGPEAAVRLSTHDEPAPAREDSQVIRLKYPRAE